MSDLMRHYMAGQLALMREFAAMFLPTVNSYKRTVPGTWAPTNVTWGIDNRTTALRAIPAGSKATRVEHRLPGADSNPYLALAASLASGLYGIEKKLALPAPDGERLRVQGAGAAAHAGKSGGAFPRQRCGARILWRRFCGALRRYAPVGSARIPPGRDGLGTGKVFRDYLRSRTRTAQSERDRCESTDPRVIKNMISRFSFPTRIVFGPGALRELGNEARHIGNHAPASGHGPRRGRVRTCRTDSGGSAAGRPGTRRFLTT